MAASGGIWSRAAAVAAATPETRNRYVDFLRALSICAVVVGHWLIAAPYLRGGELTLSNMLEYQEWTRLLTWVFQVMPVFFIVGGYSNGVSWNAARRDGRPYGEWLRGRLQRLVGPVLPLLAVWVVLGVIAGRLDTAPELVAAGSQMALIPIWFLAVYIGVVVVAPLTYAAWERWKLTSVAVLALAVVIDDVLFFAADLRAVGWLNYAFIWVAAHQLGYAWRDGYLSGPKLGLAWAIAGAALMVGLVTLGPYPVSMVSVPGQEVSNTLPPKLPMLTLAVIQIGLLLSIEKPMRRWLKRAAPWTATVLVNGMIMTVFLWHLTASTLVIAGAIRLGNVGLAVEPGSGAWWAARPLWLGLYAVGLVVFSVVFMRFERGGGARPVAAWRQVVGATLVCAGLALLALHGIGGDGPLGLNLWVLLMPFAGAALAGVNPLRSAPAKAA